MKRNGLLLHGIILILLIFAAIPASSQTKLEGLKFEGLYYLSYLNGKTNSGENYNKYAIRRGYLTVKKEIESFLSSRVTLDSHQDDAGDMKVRIKYIYAHFKLNNMGFIYKPNIEFGLVHTPWLDFEEHINYYRMQGTMFMERVGIFNSADFGFTFLGYFGGEMNDEYKNELNNKYPGKYGSFAFGVYNGGGYHAEEKNENKTVQARLTLRPFSQYLPGFQVSYLGILGKGNIAEDVVDAPDYKLNAVMLSQEHQYYTLTGTYVSGSGNKKGSWLSGAVDARDYSGFSVFGELKPLYAESNWRNVRVIGSYSLFDPNTNADENNYSRMVLGIGYDFGHRNILILDYDFVNYDDDSLKDASQLQLTMQIHY